MQTSKSIKHYLFKKVTAIALAAALCAGSLSMNVIAAEQQTAKSTETLGTEAPTETVTESAEMGISEAASEEYAEETITDAEQETADEEEQKSFLNDSQEEQAAEESAITEDYEVETPVEDSSSEAEEEKKDQEASTAEETETADLQNDMPAGDENSYDDGIKEGEDSAETIIEEKPVAQETVQESEKNDDESVPLKLDTSEITTKVGYIEFVFMESGSDTIKSAVSSNPEIATVSVGRDSVIIKGKSVGQTVISVKGSTGSTFIINVTVEEKPESSNTAKSSDNENESDKTELSFSHVSNTYFAGRRKVFNLDNTNETLISASSSNSKIVSVICYTKCISIRALRPGTAVITVKAASGKTWKRSIEVFSFMSSTSVNLYTGTKKYIDFKYAGSYSTSSTTSKIATGSIVSNSSTGNKSRLMITGKTVGSTVLTVRGPNGSVCTITANVYKYPFALSTYKLEVNYDKTYVVTAKGHDISSVTSSNTKVCRVRKLANRSVKIIPVNVGTAKVTFKDSYGVTKTVAVTVTSKYFLSLVYHRSNPLGIVYGERNIYGTGWPGTKASVTINKKTYTGTVDSDGNFTIKNIPYVKIGTLNVKFTLKGQSSTKKITVSKCKSSVYTPNYTYKNSQSVIVQLKNAHAGDKIKITVNGKSNYRTLKYSYSSTTVKVNIDKPGKYGIKMTTQLLNKFNQVLASYNEYVYLSDTVYLGYSKAQVKWLTGWNDPDKINYYSSGEQWCYDWLYNDGIHDAYLYFNADGKVTDWWVSDY